MLNGLQPLLLEEPELSLNSGVIRRLAEIIHFLQKRKTGKRQVILSTHSYDLLNDQGIAAEEIIVLRPAREGTIVESADTINDVKVLMDTGLTPAEAVIPFTEAPEISKILTPIKE